jgi:hypothetical protein
MNCNIINPLTGRFYVNASFSPLIIVKINPALIFLLSVLGFTLQKEVNSQNRRFGDQSRD